MSAHLSAAGHDVVWAGDWPTNPGDEEILSRAHQDSRILITLDKDFGELVALSTRQQAERSVAVLVRYGAELEAGALVTVEHGRVRVRPGSGRD